MAYLLVGEDVAADLALAPLDELDVGLHALCRERLGERIVDVRVRVETSELVKGPVNFIFALRCGRTKLTVMNCQTKPSLPSSHTKSFISLVLKPAASQLNDGLKLYASHWSGQTACTPFANSRACDKMGFFVSIHNASA